MSFSCTPELPPPCAQEGTLTKLGVGHTQKEGNVGRQLPKIVSVGTGVLFKIEVWITMAKCIILMYEAAKQ